MAVSLQLLKRRIKTAGNLGQIARAMETIAGTKIRKAKLAVDNNKPYAEKITSMVEDLIAVVDADKISHPYLQKNISDKKLLIAIGPDKGLCGSLPSNLFRKIIEFNDSATYLITVGRKMEKFSSRLTFIKSVASFSMGSVLPDYSTVYPLMNIINEYYLGGQVSEIIILFTEFRSFLSQVPVFKTLIPVEFKKTLITAEPLYIFEPHPETIINELLPYYVEIKLYNALVNAFTSEQAARMIAMQNARENAKEMADYLTLSYNKSRQEKITSEILDIINGKILTE